LTSLAAEVIRPLPPATRTTDRLRVIVAAAAAADPLRFDTSEAAVVGTARTLLATMVAALPPAAAKEPPGRQETTGRQESTGRQETTAHQETPGRQESLAARLWSRLTDRVPHEHDHHVLNAALILLADHDIAASTLAARVAASTRAHPYAVVSAGLAALEGPLHGAASSVAYALLTEATAENDPVATIAGRLRTSGLVHGFGHPLYPGGDARAATLMAMLDDGPVRETATRVAGALRSRSGALPNIDFALAALTLQNGMPADGGEAVFAVARTAGWLAHALEEYADRPSRFRPVGQYAGRDPST
jgi:citrate synthase